MTNQLDLAPAHTPHAPAPVPAAFGRWLLVLATGLTLNTLAGPLVLDRIDYPISESMLNQLIGLEVVTVLLVIPVMVLAAVLALSGHSAAPLVAFGPSAYTAYMFVQYVLGPEYDAYSVVVLVHLALASLAGALTLWSWSLARSRSVPEQRAGQRRRRAALLAGLACFVLLRYLPLLTGAIAGDPLTEEFVAAPTFFWSIVLLDLGVVVPGTLLAARALWQGNPAGGRGQYAVLGWFALVPPSVAAMAAVMVVRDDPNASVPTLVLLGTAALAFLGFAVQAFRPLLHR